MKKHKFLTGLLIASAAISLVSCDGKKDDEKTSNDGTQQITTYTVTFVGATVTAQTIDSGSKAIRPTDPKKEGYTFDGWFTDEACIQAFDFNSEITANLKLYAKWTEVTSGDNTGTEDNTGSGDNTGTEDNTGSGDNTGTEDNTGSGDNTGAEDNTGSGNNTGTETPEVEEFTVSFIGVTVDNQTVTKDGKATKPADPTKDGYVFVGWYTAATDGAVFDFENTAITANTEIYAIFREITLFEKMTVASNKVMSEDFSSVTELEKFEAWGTKGIYVDTNKLTADAKDFTGNNVTISDGSALMVDTTDKATKIYVDTNVKIYGVVEATFDVTLVNQGNSWTPVQFVGSNNSKNGSEIFGLRLDGGVIKYRINGGTATAGLNSVTAADSTYTIYMKLDLANSTITMTINGVEFVTDLAVDGLYSFNGIVFTSSDNGSKLLALDNVAVVYTPIEQETIAANLNVKLDALYASLKTAATYETNGVALDEALAAAKNAVSATANEEDALDAYNNGSAAIKAVLNDTQQELADGKATAIAEVKEYYPAESYLINKTSYDAAISAMETAINAAKDLTEVETVAYAEAEKIATVLADGSQMVASKEEAITAMSNKYSDENYTNADYEADYDYLNNAVAYTNAINDFEAAVNALETPSTFVADLAAAIEAADAVLEAIETDAEKLAILVPSISNDIDAYRAEDIAALELTFEAVYTQILEFKATAKAELEDLATAAAVLEVFAELTENVDNAIALTEQNNGDAITEQTEVLEAYAAEAIEAAELDETADAELIAEINNLVTTAFDEITGATGYDAAANDQIEAISAQVEVVKAAIDELIAADAFAKAKAAKLAEFEEYYNDAKAEIAENDTELANGFDAVKDAQDELIAATETATDLDAAFEAAKAAIDAKTEELEAHEYAVTYVSNYDGLDLEASTVVYGFAVATPEAPTASDAVFVGWYADETLETEFDFTAVRYSDVTLYGKWHDALKEGTEKRYYGAINVSTPTDDDVFKYVGLGSGDSNKNLTATNIDGETTTYTTSFKFGGNTKSSRYIQIVIPEGEEAKIHVAFYTGSKSETRTLYIDTTIGSTAVDTYASVSSSSQTELSILECTLSSGTYYLNATKDCKVFGLQVLIGTGITTTEYTGITSNTEALKVSYTSAEVISEGFKIDTTGLALAVKNSDTAAELSNAEVSVNNQEAFAVGTPGEYLVTVKYGKYTTYSYIITVTE